MPFAAKQIQQTVIKATSIYRLCLVQVLYAVIFAGSSKKLKLETLLILHKR
jgi:hypothetical protein